MRGFVLALFLAATLAAPAQPVAGSVRVGGAPALKLVDGWVGPDCTPRFLNVFLVPYRSDKHQLDSAKPYVQVCAWFDERPDLKGIKMATLTVYDRGSEFKYTWNDPAAARGMLQRVQVQGRKWHFSSAMKKVSSPYPKVAPGTWNLDVTVAAP